MSDSRDTNHIQLWIHQSNLLWSRLQTVSAIQVGAFTGWYFLKENDPCLAFLLVGLAFFLTLLVVGIVNRDVAYLDAFGESIRRQVPKSWISGRGCAYGVLLLLLTSDIILGTATIRQICSHRPKESTRETVPNSQSEPSPPKTQPPMQKPAK